MKPILRALTLALSIAGLCTTQTTPPALTAPYSCPKSASILNEARNRIVNDLLADPDYLKRGKGHANGPLLGHPLYTQEPVLYLAALGDKPWPPCAWDWQGMWQQQMHLARQVGAGVGVSNGWVEFTGPTSVDETAKARYLTDIVALFSVSSQMKPAQAALHAIA